MILKVYFFGNRRARAGVFGISKDRTQEFQYACARQGRRSPPPVGFGKRIAATDCPPIVCRPGNGEHYRLRKTAGLPCQNSGGAGIPVAAGAVSGLRRNGSSTVPGLPSAKLSSSSARTEKRASTRHAGGGRVNRLDQKFSDDREWGESLFLRRISVRRVLFRRCSGRR